MASKRRSREGISIDQGDLDRLSRALSMYRDALGNSTEVALRRGSIDLIKSLRARTKKAPKKRKVQAVRRGGRQVWIQGKYGKWKGQRVRLFRIDVRGKWRGAVGSKVSEVRKSPRAQIHNYGLAKKSWGWLMHRLFQTGNPSSGGPARVPPGAVRGQVVKEKDGCGVIMRNELDYIAAALPRSAISESIAAAEKSILFKVRRELDKAKERSKL